MFEWSDDKRLSNLEKHGIDFIDAKEIWQGPVMEFPSSQSGHDEERIIAIGQIEDRNIAVIYTKRGDNRRLISARKARKNEQENYNKEFG